MSGATLGQQYLTLGNGFLRTMQALIQANVINQTTATPPATPNSGDTYIIAAGATGAWSGRSTQIAYWATAAQTFDVAGWDFYTPAEGWLVYDQSLNLFYYFDGASWQPLITAASAPFTAMPAWWMCCDGSNYPFDGSNGQFSAGTANLVKFWMIRVPYPISVKTMNFRYNAAGSGGVGGMAIYNATGTTKLVSFDNFAFSGGAGPKTITNSVGGAVAVTLPSGLYLVASAQSIGPTSATTQGGYVTQGSSDNTNGWNIGTARSGTAANAMVAGVLPASLGALSLSVALGTSLPCCSFEPA